MTATKSLKSLKTCLGDRLVSIGFTVQGDAFLRKMGDTVVVIEVQKDLKRSTREVILFTVNVGISVDTLRDAATAENAETLSPEKCHWRERLGRLLPMQTDVWWSVRDEQTAQIACEEIATGLIQTALSKIEQSASSAALIQEWREGRGRGLTEYERRTNLASLLCALNRKQEADVAIQELEAASLGKGWEIAARSTVRRLRQQLLP